MIENKQFVCFCLYYSIIMIGDKMKVLTIRQPYAELIKEKVKKYEIRSRKTKYRGELYIQSSIAKIKKSSKENEFFKLLNNKKLEYGHILFKCNLIDCVYIDNEYLINMREKAPKELYGDDCIGYYAWVIDDIEVLEKPIPVKGNLGIWNYSGVYRN